MQEVECVECGATVEIEVDVMEGEIIPCPDCGTELEIIGLQPLEIDLAPTEMEDWGE